MKFKFDQLANQILNEGIGDPDAAESSAREYNRSLRDRSSPDNSYDNDEDVRRKDRNHGLKGEEKNQPYKIRITWKSGGKSFLKANGTDVVYIGTSGYYKAQMKAVSLKSNNPKIAEADVFAV